jgi:hypothetical protein
VPVTLTLDDLRVNIHHVDRSTLLSSWHWLTGADQIPIVVTALGDAFLHAPLGSGAIRMLAVGPAMVTPIASSLDDFRELLQDDAFVRQHFRPDLVRALRAAGIVLGPGEVYSYKIPPALGGTDDLDNLKPLKLEEHFAVFGKLQEHAARLRGGKR